jgi:hypothetical protein
MAANDLFASGYGGLRGSMRQEINPLTAEVAGAYIVN